MHVGTCLVCIIASTVISRAMARHFVSLIASMYVALSSSLLLVNFSDHVVLVHL